MVADEDFDSPSEENPVDTADRQAELVAKGLLFEKIEKLPNGSEITFSESSQVSGQTDVRIKVKGEGLSQPTYLHGASLEAALTPGTPES